MQYVTEEVAREIERAVEVITSDEKGFLRDAALEYIKDNAPTDKVAGGKYIEINWVRRISALTAPEKPSAETALRDRTKHLEQENAMLEAENAKLCAQLTAARRALD